VAANAAAMKAHEDELKAASEAVRATEGRLSAVQPAADTGAADASLADAKRKVADERSGNIMFRAAAAWQRTPVEEMTSESFATVVHYAVVAIAIALACTTALAAVISSLPDRGSRPPSKLSRALRGLLLARRRRHPVVVTKTVEVPGPVQYIDRMVHIPVSQDGRVLDRNERAA
jgi:hypothetical protein